MARVKLLRIAHARSGDKGDTSNVGLIALKPEYYPLLAREVTAERVQETFRRHLLRRGAALRAAQSGRAEFPAARKPGRRRHAFAQGRCAGKNV